MRLVTLLLLASCSLPQPRDQTEPDHIVALTAQPGTVAVDVGERTKLIVTGSDDDGRSVDLTARTSLATVDDHIAAVDDGGNVVGLAPGKTTLAVRAAGLDVVVPVVVGALRRPGSALGYVNAVSLVAGAAMDPIAPHVVDGGHFVAHGLPRGLTIDERTGAISGTPTIAQPPRDVVIDAGGRKAHIAIEVRCDRNIAPVEEDPPDANFVDENGDGIDGMACGPVFVSPFGDDADDGMIEHPLRSLEVALALAAALDPPRPVYAAAGTYEGPIELFAGAVLVGGYDTDFKHAAPGGTHIEGGTVAVVAHNLDRGITLERISIKASDATEPSDGSIGLFIESVKGGVHLVDVDIEAGNGADGAEGIAGERGLDGDAGAPGMPGCPPTCEAGACPEPEPGRETEQGFGNGGAGGIPGLGDDDGFDGISADDGAAGGDGGKAKDGFSDARAGSRGEDGAAGHNGRGGGSDDDGEDGDAGDDGHGGGGGGGGAGASGTCAVYGGAGGGGGAGGMGGRGGRGGGHGGASVGLATAHAIVLVEGSARIAAGHGGAGGAGGRGGTGGAGGRGGEGGKGVQGSGAGGEGGDGGNGGAGGGAGGGGGGSAFSIVVDDQRDLVTAAARLTLVVGKAGTGGEGAGERGKDGTAATVRVGGLP